MTRADIAAVMERIGLREALRIADLATDEGPPPEILKRVREAESRTPGGSEP